MLENFASFCPARLHYCCQLLYNLERINDDDDKDINIANTICIMFSSHCLQFKGKLCSHLIF